MTALWRDLKLARTLKLLLCGGGGGGRGRGGADMGTSAVLESRDGLKMLGRGGGGGGGSALVEAGSVMDDATENCENFSLVTRSVPNYKFMFQ